MGGITVDEKKPDELQALRAQMQFQFEAVGKAIDNVMWYQRLSSVGEYGRK